MEQYYKYDEGEGGLKLYQSYFEEEIPNTRGPTKPEKTFISLTQFPYIRSSPHILNRLLLI